MLRVDRSATFERWLGRLYRRNRQASEVVVRQIERAKLGNFGDTKALGGGIREMRIDVGPGYRLYYMHHGATVIVLLVGGDKGNQRRDIERAREIAKEWKP